MLKVLDRLWAREVRQRFAFYSESHFVGFGYAYGIYIEIALTVYKYYYKLTFGWSDRHTNIQKSYSAKNTYI